MTILLLLLGTSFLAKAQDYSEPLLTDEIIVESKQDLTEAYKYRRKTLGTIFSVNYEKYYPSEHISIIQNKSYEEISGGDPIPVVGAELGVKYNFSMGSLSGLFGYSAGTFSNADQNLDSAMVKITKLDINFAFDNLMAEPYFVPYVQGGLHQLEWEEDSYTGASNIVETLIAKPNFHYKLGMLLQLNWIENWIDPSTTAEGLRSSGLENTFLDIFYSGYMAYAEPDPIVGALGSDDGEANLSSSGLGIGLKLEF